ncbi:ATP-dependent DNA ligase [Mesorhizobium sp. B2-4-6]|uniref:ATP-dependent DNA ligase n=1 Tax=Mesorhizobium sp. B2-4-6 TaxID=2589943 RepID=UPI00112D1377|nr:ATP-dependent DNA ligase [Mesorhizobium sp. B2-4-6]TPL40717.1 ATP-dependent DNA ligase [Mesorhizobium sp. B2-4-6]
MLNAKERLKFIPPMLPRLVAKPPKGDGWIHEIKLDGYRTQIVIDGDDVRVFTKSGADWTKLYPGLVAAARELDVDSVIIDGEAVITSAAGLPDFAALQKAVHAKSPDVHLGAFDLLHLDGHDLTDVGLKARREMLHSIMKPGSLIQFSEAMPGDADSIFYLVDQAGIEGMVSKRVDSKYRSGRTSAWLKTKSYTVSELALIGVEREPGKPAFALMAELGTGRYVGSAFITMGREMREHLWQRVKDYAGSPPPESVLKGAARRPATQWLRPGLVGRVKHLRGEEKLRHASLLDFREED